ncbi:MAG: histone H1-like repetitive region-containing protein [Rhodospirillales bacterium]|jgi:CarD family transcriptional regulator|nr:histone H1-like repetitive region-containing protein [Rhodospirillales bacterium]MBT4005439.1 histone H1-like repetitive region-containing protein [Rhodospirillales bacterium]MBT5076532.1 histone H1-like repetitive region-containing protein [Rhodospirillales bacterium]MBT5112550.1 histone H1-like repetitive region-containing protein [Rhodospirillales bacterium]MBT5673249.1 histone H1-like repetitive region-containing protein [Rhodospirillales bacterium]
MVKKTIKKPAVKKTAAKKPAAKKPVAKKPVAKKPVAKKLVAKKPIAKKTVAKKPAAKKPAAKKAIAKKPAAKKPAAKKAVAKAAAKPAPKAAAAPVVVPAPAQHSPQRQMAHQRQTHQRRNANAPEQKAIIIMPPPPKTPLPKKIGDFASGDYVVYPTHGVGQITAIDDQKVAGHILRLFVIHFEKEKMTLSIPVNKAKETGLRKLATRSEMGGALETLRGRSRVSRAMWSRRAQEYEAKINCGDPIAIAEVVRDLHRNAGQPDQSYSERQIYEAALERFAREVGAVEKLDHESAILRIEKILKREEEEKETETETEK